jgi:serine/threonine protein phosphatase PrpC
MGTTLVAAVLSGRRAEFVNVGDSRAYCSDSLGLVQVTRDHTLAEEARRSGDPEAVALDPESNRWAAALARYLGSKTDVEPDRFGPLELTEGAWLLLCTDGLHDVMSLDEIDGFLRTHSDPQDAALGLVKEALDRGTGDNVTVALAAWPRPKPGFVPQSSPPRPESSGGRSRILMPSGRRLRPRKRVGRVVTLFLTIAVLAIALVFLVDWIRSAGP